MILQARFSEKLNMNTIPAIIDHLPPTHFQIRKVQPQSNNSINLRQKSLFGLLINLVVIVLVSQVAGQSLDYDHANLSFYFDNQGKRARVQSAADWELRRKQIVKGMQKAMGNFPVEKTKQALKAKVVEKNDFKDFLIQTIELTAEGQPTVFADVYIPNLKSEATKLPAMLALHPTGSQGKRIIGGESPKHNRQYANELAKRGYVVIAPDYPSFGDANGYDFLTDEYDSGTMLGIVNHIRCVDYLAGMEIVDEERIGVIGHSLGGHNAIFVAAFEPRLKVIVTSCGWTPFHDYYSGKIAGWTSDRYMPLLKSKYKLSPDQVPFDFYELIAALAPRPFYSNSPLHDSNFDVAGVKKAIPKIKQVYSLFDAETSVKVSYPPCGHDFPTEIRQEAYEFIDSVLSHQPRSDIGFGKELPRIEPLSPDSAIKSFNNSELQLVAAEPLVTDPVAMSFDADQRLYVVEMKDYSEQDKISLGKSGCWKTPIAMEYLTRVESSPENFPGQQRLLRTTEEYSSALLQISGS